MLDVARLAALVWAVMSCVRIRLWTFVLPSLLVTYALFLELFSGFTIRDQGEQLPATALLLVFLGPSGMPRGPLPPLPLAHMIVTYPALVDVASALLLFAAANVLLRRSEALPEASPRQPTLHRAELALTFAAVLTALSCATTILPRVLAPAP